MTMMTKSCLHYKTCQLFIFFHCRQLHWGEKTIHFQTATTETAVVLFCFKDPVVRRLTSELS